jgi:hypothetical protein
MLLSFLKTDKKAKMTLKIFQYEKNILINSKNKVKKKTKKNLKKKQKKNENYKNVYIKKKK